MNKHTVVIPTAGLGSRMGDLSKLLNKSLLPYKNKPVIAHIIDQFPADTRFILLVGYNADQVKSFCNLAYKDRTIEFVDVDDWTSLKAGPAYSFKQCVDKIDSPFWYIPCDTYFDQPLLDKERFENSYFVTKVDETMTEHYTMFEVVNNRIVDMKFKESTDDEWLAFTGVMYVHKWQEFKEKLLANSSTEIIWTIPLGGHVEKLDTWLDFGNLQIYNAALRSSQKYDFTKVEEVTYICNGRVIKWWQDSTVADKKFKRYQTNPEVYPENVDLNGNWIGYDFFNGITLYERNEPYVFDIMLQWLDNEVWARTDDNILDTAEKFYKQKTLDRVEKFLKKYPNLPQVDKVNGVQVKNWKYYLDKIDWNLLTTEVLPAYIHGDLQFDNAVISDMNEFKVIDWRQDFGGSTDHGDIYYDLAKMMGGFIINYSKIKENNFEYKIEGTEVTLSVPGIDNSDYYIHALKEFILEKGWSYEKVKLLVPIIFWNMSPLHTPPFDIFLWYLGIKLFQELENEKK
jgi:CTP:phosphocholine cytidylyltransferase-like protein